VASPMYKTIPLIRTIQY